MPYPEMTKKQEISYSFLMVVFAIAFSVFGFWLWQSEAAADAGGYVASGDFPAGVVDTYCPTGSTQNGNSIYLNSAESLYLFVHKDGPNASYFWNIGSDITAYSPAESTVYYGTNGSVSPPLTDIGTDGGWAHPGQGYSGILTATTSCGGGEVLGIAQQMGNAGGVAIGYIGESIGGNMLKILAILGAMIVLFLLIHYIKRWVSPNYKIGDTSWIDKKGGYKKYLKDTKLPF
jgi:hypothetical protein